MSVVYALDIGGEPCDEHLLLLRWEGEALLYEFLGHLGISLSMSHNAHSLINSIACPIGSERKERMRSDQHGPYVQGYTRVTMACTISSYLAIDV